jgi:hypothetical protein
MWTVERSHQIYKCHEVLIILLRNFSYRGVAMRLEFLLCIRLENSGDRLRGVSMFVLIMLMTGAVTVI